jgi:alanine-synthesizing transaminase
VVRNYFSKRIGWDVGETDYSRLLEHKRLNDPAFIDLTLSNPTQADFSYPQQKIQEALSHVQPYQPDPRGCLPARVSIAEYYQSHARKIHPGQILLTSCTSEAYSFLFKMLCDSKDEILIPFPSYPLFSILVEAEGVTGVPYPLARKELPGWEWDVASAAANISPATRGIIIVSPNNPTGTTLDDEELRQAIRWSAHQRLAVILDEVFLDYPGMQRAGNPIQIAEEEEALVFVLGGLSKCAGLPQLKLGWIVVGGPESIRQQAIQRLSFLSDAYLSVGTPVQFATPELMWIGKDIRTQIQIRIRQNERKLQEWCEANPAFTIFPRPGGWYAICRLPDGEEDDRFVYRLLEDKSAAVHPGYFYDIEDINAIVISLIVETKILEEGLHRMAALF